MAIDAILTYWIQTCAGLRWWLYKESLLCAVGHGCFPQELRSARVAVCGTDLSRLLNTVIPALPADWVLDVSKFVRGCMPIQILQDNQLLLEIDVLLCAENPVVEAIRRRHNRFL